jgi:nucleoside-diphosphate-sugar epimerase
MSSTAATVLVTGANGFVGRRICEVLSERGARVRAAVRRAGTAPALPGVEELLGDFTDAGFAASAVAGATSLITTVHPMDSDRATQHRVAVEGTPALASAAAAAGVERLIHISTAAVYDRSPGIGDVDESSALVGDGAGAYAVTKRDADLALAAVEGITRVLLRPPAILGPGPTSVWNTLRPAEMREDPDERAAVPEQSFPWVHVTDLAILAAGLATGGVSDAPDPEDGPVSRGCTPLNVAAAPATQRDYVGAVTGALGVDPVWKDASPWTGQLLAGRALRWGWRPQVELTQALAELVAGLRGER